MEVLELQRRVGIPVNRWPGWCYSIARSIVFNGVVPGRVAYGFYEGPVAPRSIYRQALIHPHAWVEMADGEVFDPLLWSYTCQQPFIYRGPARGHDLNFTRYRRLGIAEPPVTGEGARVYVPEQMAVRVQNLLGSRYNGPWISDPQIVWLDDAVQEFKRHKTPYALRLVERLEYWATALRLQAEMRMRLHGETG